MRSRLQDLYNKEIAGKLCKEFSYKSKMEAPRILKITINMGLGSEAVDNKKVVHSALADLALISGQKPVATLSRKSIAGFKIRDGWPIGAKVTLRRDNMYHFLDRLVTVCLPRIRDFRGLSHKSFDGRGNYSMGVKEQIIFPEIDYDKIDALRGMDITITTNAKDDASAYALLKAFGLPLSAKKTTTTATED
jgi:large subunit ribosomal protein L5